jgi:predicted Kef-type K+ transport protein
MELGFIAAAFGLGFVALLVRLPPLVGYLAAGFLLHALGFESTRGIELLAELGILLLLFGIGLKLNLRTLGRVEVWAGGVPHMVVSTALIGGLLLLLSYSGLPLVADLDPGQAALVAFALSFSSTVFAVKALEERNESQSLPGRIAIGILIVQDLVAVGFLVFSAGEVPTLWAIPVVMAVILARPIYGWLLDRSGHGELLILLGFFLAVGVGAGSFELVGLKPDLGALVVGMVLAKHPRAGELADRLLGFKDILLIGFFLSIGLGGLPGPGASAIALSLLLLLPLKSAGFFALLTSFRLRPRTAWHSSITLGTFSEFGLIVTAASVEAGLLPGDWSSILAVSVAASFAVAAPVNAARYRLYRRWSPALEALQREPLRAEDSVIDPGDARILVFGMGRVGAGAYDELLRREGDVVLGVDRSPASVSSNEASGRRVVRGDALDNDFWDRIRLHPGVELVVVAMSDHQANLEVVRRIKDFLPGARTAAAAVYPDEVAELVDAGVDVARNLFSEAGQGLADDACDALMGRPPTGSA